MTTQRLRAEGRWQGRHEGRQEVILALLASRGIEVSDETRERITTCTDHSLVRTWRDRAVSARSVENVFTEA